MNQCKAYELDRRFLEWCRSRRLISSLLRLVTAHLLAHKIGNRLWSLPCNLVLDLLDCLIMNAAWLYSIREHAIRIIILVNIRKHAEWWTLAVVTIDLYLWDLTVIATLIGLFLCHTIVLLIIISADPCRNFGTAINNRPWEVIC